MKWTDKRFAEFQRNVWLLLGKKKSFFSLHIINFFLKVNFPSLCWCPWPLLCPTLFVNPLGHLLYSFGHFSSLGQVDNIGKEIKSLPQTLLFSSYIFATQCHRPELFQIIPNSNPPKTGFN